MCQNNLSLICDLELLIDDLKEDPTIGLEAGKIAVAAIERAISIVTMESACDFETYEQACGKIEKSGQDQWYAAGYKEGVRTRDDERELERFGSLCR